MSRAFGVHRVVKPIIARYPHDALLDIDVTIHLFKAFTISLFQLSLLLQVFGHNHLFVLLPQPLKSCTLHLRMRYSWRNCLST